MESATKNFSVRCDLHPPMSANMFCDACNAFLCRICSEPRPGGQRVCASCQKPCREPTAAEFQQLVAQRRKIQEDAALAKTTESRTKDQAEQAKLDREARLKAEFAARKAALAQQLPSASAMPLSAASSGAAAALAPQINQPLSPAPVGGSLSNPPASALPRPERDPLAKLGERAHINVIGKAKTYMMIIGVLMVLAGGVLFLLVVGAETLINAMPQRKTSVAEEVTRDIRNGRMTKEQEEERKIRLEEAQAEAENAKEARADAESNIFKAKLAAGVVLLVGIALIVLFFMCESHPRGATQIAFYLYLSYVLLDFALFLPNFSAVGMVFRGCALYALYNAMIAGRTLHEMREEEARYA